MKEVRCHKVWFYSPADETSFFSFIKQIKAVHRVQGMGKDIFLHVKTPVSTKSLRDLIGLFKRYNLGLDELNALKTTKNAHVFNGSVKKKY